MIIVFSIAVFIASIIVIHKFLDEDGILGLFGIIGITLYCYPVFHRRL